MKKLILSVITLCMIFSLISCGNDTDTPKTEKDLNNMTEKDLEDILNAMRALSLQSILSRQSRK